MSHARSHLLRIGAIALASGTTLGLAAATAGAATAASSGNSGASARRRSPRSPASCLEASLPAVIHGSYRSGVTGWAWPRGFLNGGHRIDSGSQTCCYNNITS